MKKNPDSKIISTLIDTDDNNICLLLHTMEMEGGNITSQATMTFELEAAENFAEKIFFLCMKLRQAKFEKQEAEGKAADLMKIKPTKH